MDARRSNRTVIDPKVRQVGFITPSSNSVPSASAAAAAPPGNLSSAASLSPVMIPPPRHHSSVPVPVPVPVPATLSPLRSREKNPNDLLFPIVGSYNPSDSLVASPPSWSWRTDPSSECGDDDVSVPWGGNGKGASSLPGSSSGEMMMVAKKSALPAKSVLTTTSTVKTVTGVLTTTSTVKTVTGVLTTTSTVKTVTDNDGGALLETQNEAVGSSKPLKQKLSRADRRAIQEAQRAAKAAAKEAGDGSKNPTASGAPKQGKAFKSPPQKKDATHVIVTAASEKKPSDRLAEKDRKKDAPPPRMQYDDKHKVEKAKRRAVVNQFEARNRVELFRHLPQYEHGTQLPDLESKFFQLEPMHPSVYKVGLQYLSGDISGSNARCVAMLLAFREAIKDYSTPPEKLFIRDLTAKINSYVSFFTECRLLSISMGNAIKFLKNRIAKLPDNLSELEKKSSLQSDIDHFISEKIVLADKVIVRHAVTKIRDGDVLLTYGSSTVVEMILLYAHELGKQFRVAVVDSRPKFEGKALLRRLIAKGLSCTYTHINAISHIMHEVTRVFLGAASVFSNGTVYSRVGTASVAMVAHAFRVPVLICCEAYKFHERVQLDSICSNELGGPDVISKVPGRKDLSHLDNWAEDENLQLLNLSYDATPSDYVSMIVTDYGMLPPTSVPVIVREYRRELLWT